MNELAKIKDVSARYAVTARTLRYYEDMGLLSSIRDKDSGHRMYDGQAVTRLRQILILRRMGISVKNLKRIFNASDADVLLDVLEKKAEDIDGEVALLHELKDILMEFIRQVKDADFRDAADVKRLYEKAAEIETQITVPEGSAGRLAEVTDKLDERRFTTPVVVRTYRQRLAASRFIGRPYASGGAAWADWGDGTEMLTARLGIDLKALYEDGDALIGLMRHPQGKGSFEYWLGFFTPAGTPVPEGYAHMDFPPSDIGACWLYGKEDEVFGVEPLAYEALGSEGFNPIDGWWFERYHPVRAEADGKGFVIMDICFFLEGER
jgi:DNA-binding transcriptional MerR regulator